MEPVEKSLQAQECGPSYVFYIPIEVKAMLAPTSKIPEERAFVFDSGASMHMLSKKVLHSDELDTLRRSRNPTVVLTANGEVHNHEVARVHVHDLNVFVTVQLHEETPAEVHNHEESQVHVHDLNVFVTVQLHEETPVGQWVSVWVCGSGVCVIRHHWLPLSGTVGGSPAPSSRGVSSHKEARYL